MTEEKCTASLYENIRKDSPDIVFNLSGVYGWEKANLIPAVLEIAAVPYTGSGMLGLSLARNYSKLFPLLANSGIRIPPFLIMEAGSAIPAAGVNFPLLFFRDDVQYSLVIRSIKGLKNTLDKLPKNEEILLQEQVTGEKVSVYLLDNDPIEKSMDDGYLRPAQKAYQLMEARGLVRFDFIRTNEPLLLGIDAAPDPLDKGLIQEAASAGWDEDGLFQNLIRCAGRDNSTKEKSLSPNLKKTLAEKIQVRQLNWDEADLNQIIKIENACFNSYDAYTREDFERWYHYNPDLCLVAEIEGRIAGYIMTRVLPEKGDLASLAISPAFRKLGVGTALFNCTARRVKEYGMDHIDLEVRKTNAAGFSFWKRMGFVPFGTLTAFYGDGEDAIQMRKKIA